MRRIGPTSRIVVIVGVAVLAAVLVAAATQKLLPGPAWITVSVGAAGAVLVGFIQPLLDASSEIWTSRLKRSAERSEAHRILEERHGGPDGRFRRVAEIRERAIVYGVQQAIPLPVGHDGDLSHDLPKYVPRTTDGVLRAKLTARSATGGMVIIKGDSTWGKTRSLLEAVTQTLETWRVIAPSSGAEMTELVDSGLDIRRTVFWLDELVGFLDSPTPLTLEMVRKAIDHGAIIVGTIWKSDFSRLTRQGGRVKQVTGGSIHTDTYPAARAVLTSSIVDIVEMFAHFDSQELETAKAVSGEDPRWATALAYESHLEPIKVLAAADWLLERYRRPDHTAGGIVLQTAVELLSIDHPEPLPESVLKDLASLLLPDEIRPILDPSDWFAEAAEWACESFRESENQLGSIAPLTRMGDPGGPQSGYTVPDILVQTARAALPGGRRLDASALLDHLSASACATVGLFFYHRDEDETARPLIEHAARADVSTAYLPFGYLLEDEDPAAAVTWFRKAIEAGDKDGHIRLGHVLSEQPGRAEDAETEYRAAIAAGLTAGHHWLGSLLSKRPGRKDEAEAQYRAAIAADHTIGHYWLGNLLSKQPGREDDAEAEYRAAIAAGHTAARGSLGNLLAKQPGREDDAETEYNAAIAAGDIDVHYWLGSFLFEQTGREDDAEAVFRAAIAAGATDGHFWLGVSLSEQAGREDDAEAALREAIATGDTDAYQWLGIFLSDQVGREDDAEAAFRAAIAIGDTDAYLWLGLFLSKLDGRQDDAETAYRCGIADGYASARTGLAQLLIGLDRLLEARHLLDDSVEAGDPAAVWTMGKLELKDGNRVEAERHLRRAVELGVEAAAELVEQEFGSH